MLFFVSKERITDFLVVKKRGSLNLWKQGRSRSCSSADCPVRLILAAAFIAQHHALGALLFLRRSCRTSPRAACPSAWRAHTSPRATCPAAASPPRRSPFAPTLLHAPVFLIARLIVQLLHCSRGLAYSECSIRSTLPRSAAFLTARLLGAWGSGSAAGTGALLYIWSIVATSAPVCREGCH